MKKIVCMVVAMILSINIYAQKEYDKRPSTYNYNRAVEELQKENYKSAMEYFDAELMDNPKNGWAIGWEGWVNAKYGNYGDALEQLDKAIKLLPKKDFSFVASMYATKAQVNLQLEDTLSAIQNYETAMSLAPDNVNYIIDHCNIFFDRENYVECEKDVKKMHIALPNSALVYTYDGRNKHAQKQYDMAIEKYSHAVKLDNGYSSAYSFRAESYLTMGKYSEAAQDVVKALSINHDEKAYSMLDSLAIKSFTNIYTRLLAQKNTEPNVPYWTYCLGEVCNSAKKYCESLDFFKESAKTNEYQALTYRRIASIYRTILRPNAAIEYLNKSIDTDSTGENSVYQRAMCYIDMERYQEAVSDVNSLIAKHPDNDYLYKLRGFIRKRSGNLRNAIDDYTMAIELDPNDPDYLVARGVAYIENNKKELGIADLKKTLSLLDNPDYDKEVSASYKATCYGWLYRADNGDRDSKNELLTISHDFFEKEGADSGDMYDAACAHALANETKEALNWLQKSIDNGYADFENIVHDSDLKNIRDTEEFDSILMRAKQERMDLYNCDGADDENSSEYEESIVEVPFTRESGIYKVKCTINELPLNFYFDTGAADVTISNVEAAFMMKNGYLSRKDVVGKEYFGDANGDISEGTIINLRKVEFAGLQLEGVKASVVHSQNAPLLLGQTVLSRLGKIEIDYSKNVLKITKRTKKQSE